MFNSTRQSRLSFHYGLNSLFKSDADFSRRSRRLLFLIVKAWIIQKKILDDVLRILFGEEKKIVERKLRENSYYLYCDLIFIDMLELFITLF